jgi:putative ABC transport system substrate-binding protein
LGANLKRRDFITLLGGTAMAWPLTARAQQPARPVIGALITASPAEYADRMVEFRRGLSDAGFVEGRDVSVEYRFADNQLDRVPALLADLIGHKVAVIFITGESVVAVPMAKTLTQTIPIVFTTGSDPVARGLVATINRPGGNATGVSLFSGVLGGKRLELLHEAIPAANKVALLVFPANPAGAAQDTEDVQAAARRLGLEIIVLGASNESEIDRAFATMVELKAGALFLGSDAFLNIRREQIAALALRHAIPTMSTSREGVVAGELMAYGTSPAVPYRQAGDYVGRILKGAKPGGLPIMFPTKFDLVVNLKTAKAIGLTIPESFLARADEVIE